MWLLGDLRARGRGINGHPVRLVLATAWILPSEREDAVTLTEKTEQLATEVFGKAAALSVDSEDGGVVVRCWDLKGVEVARTARKRTRTEALGAMREKLERMNFLGYDEGSAPDEEVVAGGS